MAKVRYTVLRGKDAANALHLISGIVDAAREKVSNIKEQTIIDVLNRQYKGCGWVQIKGEWYSLSTGGGKLHVYEESGFPVTLWSEDYDEILSDMENGEVYRERRENGPRLYAPLRVPDAVILGEEEVQLR